MSPDVALKFDGLILHNAIYFKFCKMNIRRLKQFAIAFLMVVSLMVPSVSACTCDHYKPDRQSEVSSCHRQPDMSEMDEGDDSELQGSSSILDPDADCICDAAASKV